MDDKSAISIIKDTPIDKLYANFYKGDIKTFKQHPIISPTGK
jgi:hypothetical protein